MKDVEASRIMCQGCGSCSFNFILYDDDEGPYVHCANCGASMTGLFVVTKQENQIEN